MVVMNLRPRLEMNYDAGCKEAKESCSQGEGFIRDAGRRSGMKIVWLVWLVLAVGASNIMKIPKRTKPRVSNFPPEHDAEAKRLIHYAGMAYCGVDTIRERSCRPCQRIDKEVKFNDIVESNLDGHALILLDHTRKEIVISIRGLITWTNLIQALSVTHSDIETHSYINMTRVKGVPEARVHTGFKRTADSIVRSISPKLNRLVGLYRGYKLQLVGHSLGGAIATLLAVSLHQELRVPYSEIILTTYGQPRVGNEPFAKWFNSLPIQSTRVVNENDPIPQLPFTWLGYAHTKTEMYISSGKSISCPPGNRFLENPGCSMARNPEFGATAHTNAWGIKLEKESC